MSEIARRPESSPAAKKTAAKKAAPRKAVAKKAAPRKAPAKKAPAKKASAKKASAKKAAKKTPAKKVPPKKVPPKKAPKNKAPKKDRPPHASTRQATSPPGTDALTALPAPPSNPCLVLGLGEQFTATELRRSWRAYAARHHPDKGGDATTFARGLAAYETLARRIT